MIVTATQVPEPVGGFSNFGGFTAPNWQLDRPPVNRTEVVEQTARSEDAIRKQAPNLATSMADIISLDERLAEVVPERAFAKEKDVLLGAIRKLANLSDGWDGENGRAPTGGIIDDAVAMPEPRPQHRR